MLLLLLIDFLFVYGCMVWSVVSVAAAVDWFLFVFVCMVLVVVCIAAVVD